MSSVVTVEPNTNVWAVLCFMTSRSCSGLRHGQKTALHVASRSSPHVRKKENLIVRYDASGTAISTWLSYSVR
jgi:hypothetical protein